MAANGANDCFGGVQLISSGRERAEGVGPRWRTLHSGGPPPRPALAVNPRDKSRPPILVVESGA